MLNFIFSFNYMYAYGIILFHYIFKRILFHTETTEMNFYASHFFWANKIYEIVSILGVDYNLYNSVTCRAITKEMIYIENDVEYEHKYNSVGCRGGEINFIDSCYNILALGDSFTEGMEPHKILLGFIC